MEKVKKGRTVVVVSGEALTGTEQTQRTLTHLRRMRDEGLLAEVVVRMPGAEDFWRWYREALEMTELGTDDVVMKEDDPRFLEWTESIFDPFMSSLSDAPPERRSQRLWNVLIHLGSVGELNECFSEWSYQVARNVATNLGLPCRPHPVLVQAGNSDRSRRVTYRVADLWSHDGEDVPYVCRGDVMRASPRGTRHEHVPVARLIDDNGPLMAEHLKAERLVYLLGPAERLAFTEIRVDTSSSAPRFYRPILNLDHETWRTGKYELIPGNHLVLDAGLLQPRLKYVKPTFQIPIQCLADTSQGVSECWISPELNAVSP